MMHLRRWLTAAAATLVFAFVAPVHADDVSDSTEASDSRGEQGGVDLSAEGFQPAQGTRPGDEVPGGVLMIAAYGVMGTLLLGYVIVLVRRQRAVGAELDSMRRRLVEMDDRLDDLEHPSGT
jgi:hypothetical protein